MSDSRVDLDTVIIIPGCSSYREKAAGLTALPCSSCSIAEKPATTELHHSQTRDACSRHPHPLRQQVTKNPVHSSPPQGQQDTTLARITGLSLYCCLAHGKPVEGNKSKTMKKGWTNQKWKQKKSEIFICERNGNWLTKTRKGCSSVNRPPWLPWLRVSCLSIWSLIKGTYSWSFLKAKEHFSKTQQLRCPNLELCHKYLEHCHSYKTKHKRLFYTKWNSCLIFKNILSVYD